MSNIEAVVHSDSESKCESKCDELINEYEDSSDKCMISADKCSGISSCKYVDWHEIVFASGVYNFEGAKIPVESNLNVSFWKKRLKLATTVAMSVNIKNSV